MVYTKPKLYAWEFRRIHLHALFHSFLNSSLNFQSKSIWSQTYIKQASIYFIVKWHFMNSVCPCSHACLLHNNETSSADRHIKFSLVYSFYCHDHDSENAKWHLIFFRSCLLHWSTPLAFDLWIKWRCIWKLWEQMNVIAPLFEVKCKQWNTDKHKDFNGIYYHYHLIFNFG